MDDNGDYCREVRGSRRKETSEKEAAVVFVEQEPPPKVFKKKCLNVPSLDSYVEEEVKDNLAWWSTWNKNPLGEDYNGPRLNTDEVRKVAAEVGYGWQLVHITRGINIYDIFISE